MVSVISCICIRKESSQRVWPRLKGRIVTVTGWKACTVNMCDVTRLKNIFNFLYKKNKFTILYRDILLNMAASPVRSPKDGIQTKSYKSKFILVEWFEIDTNVKA